MNQSQQQQQQQHSRMPLKLIDVILTVEDMNSELVIVVGEVADKLAAA